MRDAQAQYYTTTTTTMKEDSHHQRRLVLIQRASQHHLRGWRHYLQCNFDASLVEWRKAVMIRDGILGSDHISTKESHDLIGCCLQRSKQGLNEKARNKYLKTLLPKSIRHETNGDKYKKCHKFDQALKEYKKSLDLEEPTLGRDHPVVATLHRKMAATLRHMGQMDQSILVYCDALA
jgi:tetratricopeptide (TPR) repeat protein